VLENDNNQASLLDPTESQTPGKYRAQWNDDYHHSWHVLLTGEEQGYYKDYSEAGRNIALSLREGFVYQGEPSQHRKGARRGESSTHLRPLAFVNFLQNHDQIGNRAKGERLTMLAKPEAIAAALSVLMLAPAVPMLFMGEEWGAKEPFPFFCDFKGELASAIREGRKREFAEAYAAFGNDVPDPLAETTFVLATLDWSARESEKNAARLALIRDLARVRREHIVPIVEHLSGHGAEVWYKAGVLFAKWHGDRELMLLANVSCDQKPAPPMAWGRPIWNGAPTASLRPWSVFAAIGGC